MFFKRKHILVIVVSSAIIALVFILTLVGYNLYSAWKKEMLSSGYRNSISRITAEIFEKDIVVSNVKLDMYSGTLFSPVPVCTGNLRNNTGKDITSIFIEVSFQDKDGKVLYKDWFNPMIDAKSIGMGLSFSSPSILGSGDSITFRHIMQSCPHEITEMVKTQSNFAKSTDKDKIRLVYKLRGLNVL